jgi:aryl-alcohol dehydrogenase-like predicted oxidoreductase
VYFGYSWGFKESRHQEYRSYGKLLQSLDDGLRAAGLDYVDLWRISLPMETIPDLDVMRQVEEGAVEALQRARKAGKTRFTGVSTHNRPWLNWLIEQHPDTMQAVLFPYTAASREMPGDSVFEAVRRHDVGVFGIKPFADNALFAPGQAEENDRRARLALRYILGNPAITAPIPGIAGVAQLENAVRAVAERRTLDAKEKAELERLSAPMWANLSPGHRWLKNWECV